MSHFCFAAGTPIHTNSGTRVIEQLAAGDLVLSRREQGGERAFQRVIRTVRADDSPVVCLTAYGTGAADGHTQKLIVTSDHLFFVAGYDRDTIDPDFYDMYMENTGWRPATALAPGALIELADGGMARVGDINRIWRTSTEGLGWIEADRDSPVGWHIDMRHGRIVETPGIPVVSEFATDTTFRDRHEDAEWTRQWEYKCPVFNVELEDLHTCYAGDMGLWAHTMHRS